MTVDAGGLALLALVGMLVTLLGLNLDCNRRVRELQRGSDWQIRALDALASGRRLPDRARDTVPERRRRRA